MPATDAIYECLLEKIAEVQLRPEQIVIGLTWTLAKLHNSTGLAMSPQSYTRTLPWSGQLTDKNVAELATWITSWNEHEASVAMACINAVLNSSSPLLKGAQTLHGSLPGNLRVFEHFLPKLKDKHVVVVGRYPGMEIIEQVCHLSVLERKPGAQDLPDTACEYLIPEADWVFLSATSIINKTFPRLAELSRHANLVLMGPTVPWLEELAEFGVDYLAGVRVRAPDQLLATVMQGGGTRIFEGPVEYCLHDFTQQQMATTKEQIAETVSRRDQLKAHMQAWYEGQGKGRFPQANELLKLDDSLAGLDNRYRRLWNATQQVAS